MIQLANIDKFIGHIILYAEVTDELDGGIESKTLPWQWSLNQLNVITPFQVIIISAAEMNQMK